MSRDNAPRSTCNEIRGDLELYAEGELRDRAVLASVRGHLGECRICRGRLRERDALTRTILSGSTSSSSRFFSPGMAMEDEERVDRIMERILALPLRSRTPLVGVRGALSPNGEPERARAACRGREDRAPEHRRRRAWQRAFTRWAGIAAACLAGGWILQAIVALGTRIPARGPAPLPEDRVAHASMTAGEPRLATSDLRWLLEKEPDGGGEEWRGPFRLYGLRRADGVDPRYGAGGDHPEWLVHARAAAPPRFTRKPRIFLVADGESGKAPLEIDPVTWSALTASAGALPVDRSGPSYQVYVLKPTNLLDTAPSAAPPACLDRMGGILPVLEGGPRLPAHRWVTPASLRY